MSSTEFWSGDPAELAAEILRMPVDNAWLDAFAHAFDEAREAGALQRFLQVWGLSQSEAARLFGVSRQAVSKWLVSGVPSDRVEALADLSATTDVLVRHLKRERIPAVVRRAAPALDGESLLDRVAAGRYREVLLACRQMFDFRRVHH